MPVIGNPQPAPIEPGVSSSDQRIVQAPINTRLGTPTPLKRRASRVQGGQAAQLKFQLLDSNGVPSNLVNYGIDTPGPGSTELAHVVLKMREAVDRSSAIYTVDACEILDATTGLVLATMPEVPALMAAVYHGEFGVVDSDGKLAFTNQTYIWVDRGMWSNNIACGPPQLDEVRLACGDNDPSGNFIIDELEFALPDICLATERAVRMWNEAQPPIDTVYNTSNYPWRDYWIKAIVGQLYIAFAKGYLRNYLPAQAAGVNIDDQNKWQQYEQLGQQMLADYREWVKQKRTQINCEAAITSYGSPYDIYNYWF